MTIIAGHHVGAKPATRLAKDVVPCDRCGILRSTGGGSANTNRNLCQACTYQLTAEELKAWER